MASSMPPGLDPSSIVTLLSNESLAWLTRGVPLLVGLGLAVTLIWSFRWKASGTLYDRRGFDGVYRESDLSSDVWMDARRRHRGRRRHRSTL